MLLMKNRVFIKSQELQPKIKFSRSKFDLSFHHKTTFNQGDLVPCYLQEVYPGDTFNCSTTFACRTTSPFIRVPMDNLCLDTFYFYVPSRLLYNKWSEVMGENKNGYWASNNMPEVPVVETQAVPSTAQLKKDYAKTIANYFGINFGGGLYVSDLPFRAYALIYNEWFRDENLQEPVNINFGDNSGSAQLNSDDFSVTNYHGKVAKVNKLHDYFTSCLPAPQKGDSVVIPMLDSAVGTNSGNPRISSLFKGGLQMGNSDELVPITSNGVFGNSGAFGFQSGTFSPTQNNLVPLNLYALSSEAGGTINDLRFAFQMQKMLEKDARGGTRYSEYLQAHFGVISPDARLQRPEFLGGKRVPLSMQQVTQTSASSDSSPLGQVSAYSLSNGSSGFSKGFVEHGFIVGVMCVRQYHTYQQGIERFWFRKKRTDFYDPVFANIGEQPVYLSEIQADKVDSFDEVVFGYNEAFADLRYKPSRISGELNSNIDSDLDVWHFGDFYDAATNVKLDDDFIKETPEYLDRCLSVPSTTLPNFIIDILFKQSAIRVMPAYSIPGYADHH